MYCSSSQLLLIRLVGPPDVVAVVAVAEAVEGNKGLRQKVNSFSELVVQSSRTIC